jgi:hypothetical protein
VTGSGSCELRAAAGVAAALRAEPEWPPFALIEGGAAVVEMPLAPGPARVRVWLGPTEQPAVAYFEGLANSGDFDLHSSEPWFDGAVIPHPATRLRWVSTGRNAVTVALTVASEHFEPRRIEAAVPCRSLTLAPAPRSLETTSEEGFVRLRAGTRHAVARELDSEPIGWLTPRGPLRARVLARRGELYRVAVALERATVVAWLPSTAIETGQGDALVITPSVRTSIRPVEPLENEPVTLSTCSSRERFFVDEGSREVGALLEPSLIAVSRAGSTERLVLASNPWLGLWVTRQAPIVLVPGNCAGAAGS